MQPWQTPAVERLIALALDEDLGRGDLTTTAVVPPEAVTRGRVVAREELVVAGLPLFEAILKRVDPTIGVTLEVHDGDSTESGVTLAFVEGAAAGILSAERTALNFLQHLSGIATYTRRFVDLVTGTPTRIADTRKTTPGMRLLEKYAVRMGGGANHRGDLGSGVLIKDNHIAIAGSVRVAVERARAAAPHGMKIEVEVDDLAGLDQALEAGADIVLLDNFRDREIANALSRVRAAAPGTLIEVSGGVTIERVPGLVEMGVDLVSVGALTHSAPAVDIALDLEI